MSDTVISVENLSKLYRIGSKAERKDTLFAHAADLVKAPFRNFQNLAKLNTYRANGYEEADDLLWALRDVSFDVKQGEVLGIIGRNGAGKSTLLKILSRVAEPTRGRIRMKGRVSALLEVGTGFHPELTGRENVYLNGTILGMSKREIDSKFDAIVDFSGVEKFLDTPVKRYSSGMKVRLAFAVAAHLDPEILIVDEVLAVGDAEFQKKCLGKMQDVASGEGRTVLFVSHNMNAVQNLTSRCVYLESGSKVGDGETEPIVKAYTESLVGQRDFDYASAQRSLAYYGDKLRILGIKPVSSLRQGFYSDESLRFEIVVRSLVDLTEVRFGITASEISGGPVFTTMTNNASSLKCNHDTRLLVEIERSGLVPGTYSIAVSASQGTLYTERRNFDVVNPGPVFQVLPIARNGKPLYRWAPSYGHIHIDSSRIIKEV